MTDSKYYRNSKQHGFHIILLIGFLLMTGCKSAETATPLGCNKKESRYFDPEKGECVTATNELQAYRLNWYRRLHQVINEGVTEASFDIFFNKYLTNEEFISLMKQLKSVKITGVTVFFPNVNNGASYGGNLGAGVDITRVVDTALADSLKLYNSPEEAAPFREALRKGEFSVYHVEFTSDPRSVRDWWDHYYGDICVARASIDWFDNAQINICFPGAVK